MNPNDKKKRTALIIGAGPGGLTSAYELLQRTDVLPIVIEFSDHVGGISRTVKYKGNRIDIGGHRFFSKSDRVMNWWMNIMPIEKMAGDAPQVIKYQGKQSSFESGEGVDPEKTDRVMLLRPRKSRILFLGQFFDYPISLSAATLKKLGFVKTVKIGLSYVYVSIFPYKDPKNLEEFYINQFGEELYRTFFKSYTEKVWGVSCKDISAEWGAQRTKGLSLFRAGLHFIKSFFVKKDIRDKNVETSLIDQFLYPKYGPGHMWEEVSKDVKKMGGVIHMEHTITGLAVKDKKITGATIQNRKTGETLSIDTDYIFSTMPIQELTRLFAEPHPPEVQKISDGLVYRDFITVGLLLKKLKKTDDVEGLIRDTWIYIQEPGVKVGRIQIFNNWSPYMVADKDTVWIGLEYFCTEGDELWQTDEEVFRKFAIEEVAKINFIDPADVLDSIVIKMKKTYPGYFGTYEHFDTIREYFDQFPNLFLIGRNGMHKYNNQDHSMLTAMTAVDNILEGREDKSNIWAVNTEQDYHEEKKG